ncbi:hypothetical protein ACH5RR_025905 [Cinchona calisaya]|uniref:Uncharacterized protein n=1 Tax=Cinchona calisaya TaxID=153742 RepID=A0ABD2Z249_9GENT
MIDYSKLATVVHEVVRIAIQSDSINPVLNPRQLLALNIVDHYHKLMRRMGISTFDGRSYLDEKMKWLEKMQETLIVLGILEELKFGLVKSYLTRDATIWWKRILHVLAYARPVT